MLKLLTICLTKYIFQVNKHVKKCWSWPNAVNKEKKIDLLKNAIEKTENDLPELNRFALKKRNQPIAFDREDIKLNPLTLAVQQEPQELSYEDEEKLFAKHPEQFEKRMVIIDGSNVARWFVF